MMYFSFDEKNQVLVDEMGIMHPASNIAWLMQALKSHIAHSPLELEALGRRTVEERRPRMVDQFNFDYFK